MCGIAGWLGHTPAEGVPANIAARMVRAIAHRGPDAHDLWIDEGAALGHARLAVIDLSTGAQPLASHDGRFVIVYNGEVYNYRELREDLAARGARFASASDTEVVIELYREAGVDGFTRLRGMYAFALWDRRERCGVLARDPAGIKPLFVRTTPGGVLFGSEAKAILAATGPAALDAASLHLLLNFRYLPGRRTLFRGVEQLAPGEVLVWRDGAAQRRVLAPPAAGDGDLAALLEQAVARHLVADVEVAGFLSGGVDSALLCALARRRAPGRFRSFTLPVGDDPAEADNAAETARVLDIDNLRGDVAAPSADEIPHLVRHLEVPKVNAWQSFRLAAHARRSVKVALSGLGADELFYGYNAHALYFWLQAGTRGPLRPPATLAGRAIAALARRGDVPWTEPERAGLMLAADGDWPRAYGLLRNLWDAPALRRRIYGPALLDQPLPDAFDELRALWPQRDEPLEAFAEFEWRNKMVNDLLWHEDRASMAVGLEVRVPYLDLDLAARVRALPRRVVMPRGRRKRLLRQLAAPWLPSHVLGRPKSGFQVDAPAFVLRGLAGALDRWLSPEAVRAAGLFNPEFVAQLRRLPPARWARWHAFMLYLMLQTHVWLHEFAQGNAHAQLRREDAA
jgi:asparagine synthase (glutamine-hydrolysing)